LLSQSALLLPWFCSDKVRTDLLGAWNYLTGVEHLPTFWLGKLGYLLFTLGLGESVLPWVWLMAIPAAAAMATLGLYGLKRVCRRPHGRLLAWTLTIVIVAVGTSRHGASKYLYPWLPIFVLILAEGFWELRSRRLAWIALGALGLGFGYADLNYYTHRQLHTLVYLEPWRDIAQGVRQDWQRGDVVVLTNESAPFAHYVGPLEAPHIELLVLLKPSETVSEQEALSAALAHPTETLSALMTRLRREGYRRLWLIECSPGQRAEAQALYEVTRMMTAWCDRQLVLLTRRRFVHDPDAWRKRRWVNKLILDDRVVVSLYVL